MVPVIESLAADGAVVSVDTMRAEVARAAVDAGATIVNDVSGGLADPDMLAVVADAGATYVAMHWRAHSDRMAEHAVYDGPGRRGRGGPRRARRSGSRRCWRPASTGPGSCSTPAWASPRPPPRTGSCCAISTRSPALGFPLLVGASRKRSSGDVLAARDGGPRPVDEREYAGTALTVLLAGRGVWGLRVHDVRAHRDVLRVLARTGGVDSDRRADR